MQNKDTLVSEVFDDVSNKYDLMNDLTSLGIHRVWKQNLINWLLPQKNTTLIDVACGTGDIASLYLKKISFQGKVVCLDSNKKMIKLGKKKQKKNINIKWIYGRAEKIPFPNNFFNYYTISFGIRNVVNIDSALSEAHRVLKPGGRFICLEFSKIENEIFEKLYKLYEKIIPKIGKIIVGKSSSYEYLINSIREFYTQEELLNKIKQHNFKKIEYRNLSCGIAAIHSGWKI